MAGEIVDVIQRQPNNQVGPTRRCATEAPFHLLVEERPFENQISLPRRQPDVHELSWLDPLAPHHISRSRRAPASTRYRRSATACAAIAMIFRRWSASTDFACEDTSTVVAENVHAGHVEVTRSLQHVAIVRIHLVEATFLGAGQV